MATVTACVTCGADLPAEAGNRRRYCGQACKRSAEYELRRLNGLIYRAEKTLQDFRLGKSRMFDAKLAKARLTAAEAEVDQLRARLRLLLDQDDTDGAGAYDGPDRARS